MQSVQAEEVQPRRGGDATLLNGVAVFIEHRQPHPIEVEAVANGPDNGTDASLPQVQLGTIAMSQLGSSGRT